MQYSQYQFDLPLSQISKESISAKNSHNPSTNCCRTPAFDLPRQLTTNPYNHRLPSSQINSQMIKGGNSISKCAVTEMSSHEDLQQNQSLTPICQKLFSNCNCLEKEVELPETLRSQDIITQATFKPNELKQYLSHENKSNPKLKQILQETVFKRNNNDCHTRRAFSSRANDTTKSKTKYQRILEQYYRQKPKIQNIKKRASLQNVPNFKLKHRQTSQTQNGKENIQYLQDIDGFKKEPIRDIINKYFSQKTIPLLEATPAQNKVIQKTFSTQKMRAQSIQIYRSIKFNEMGTTEKSQTKTQQYKLQKENISKTAILPKKYTTNTIQPLITQCKNKSGYNRVGSYAKLYYDKIKLKK